jgi:hypothetical protein
LSDINVIKVGEGSVIWDIKLTSYPFMLYNLNKVLSVHNNFWKFAETFKKFIEFWYGWFFIVKLYWSTEYIWKLFRLPNAIIFVHYWFINYGIVISLWGVYEIEW